MPGAGRLFLKAGQIGRVPGKTEKINILAGKSPGREHGRRQLTDDSVIVVEREAEHDRAVLHVAGEYFIVIELRLELLQGRLKTGDVLEFFLRQLLQHLEARAFVTFGEHHVETDDRNFIMVEQLVKQRGKPVARPRPAALAAFVLFGKALLVDIEYDDTRVDRARHGQRETRVVNDRLQAVDQR